MFYFDESGGFYLSVGKNLSEGATEPPEEARELVHASRRRHIDTTHDLYELREARDKADR